MTAKVFRRLISTMPDTTPVVIVLPDGTRFDIRRVCLRDDLIELEAGGVAEQIEEAVEV